MKRPAAQMSWCHPAPSNPRRTSGSVVSSGPLIPELAGRPRLPSRHLRRDCGRPSSARDCATGQLVSSPIVSIDPAQRQPVAGRERVIQGGHRPRVGSDSRSPLGCHLRPHGAGNACSRLAASRRMRTEIEGGRLLSVGGCEFPPTRTRAFAAPRQRTCRSRLDPCRA